MKEDLINLDQAAEVLGIGTDQLRKLIKKGDLRPHPASKSTKKDRLFRASDVAALKEIRSKRIGPEAAYVEARQSAIATKAMRKELDQIRYVMGLDIPIMRTDRDTVMSIVLKAEDALRTTPTQNPSELLEWSRVLYSLTEAHFEAITFYSDQKEPWRVFLNLGRRLIAGQNIAMTTVSLELYNTYLLLSASLRHARQAAYFHVRTLYGNMQAERLFPEVKSCPHEDVIALGFLHDSNGFYKLDN